MLCIPDRNGNSDFFVNPDFFGIPDTLISIPVIFVISDNQKFKINDVLYELVLVH